MTLERMMPVCMFVFSVIAAAVYLRAGDWRHAGYWFSAAAITFFVTAL